ncbi:RNA polymerase factor sigma-70 [Thermomonas hydrothermalis]|uniref:RNA polymerase sigma-70 factor, ECF subfamily n=1 Tax=Thermomonas hydrothermalis TaxID=213588 RepID=A0A1M4WT10_9GAMM|nr:RNA polymerase factor sigma-70 [Thermomonas hydrothermalis]SHE84183.1 RNA polymerase sigma-70 factor, ECF subfamily [Thermomonas hydrothermalis]
MNELAATAMHDDHPTTGAQAWLHDRDFMADLRRQMLKFATLQLAEPQLAEDAVQEALIGAMANADRFAGRSAFKTWVLAILKHKIADLLRQSRRMVPVSQLTEAAEEDDGLPDLFDRGGHWRPDERPQHWVDPETATLNAQFWQVFETCLERLPAQQARVFMMREFIELETSEICQTLGLSVTNVNVILYRARIRLRECLENRWFAKGGAC